LRIHELKLFLKRRYSAMSISPFSLDEHQAIDVTCDDQRTGYLSRSLSNFTQTETVFESTCAIE